MDQNNVATQYGSNFTTAASDGIAVSKVIPMIREGNFSSEYFLRDDGSNLRVSISHSVEKKTKYERHLFKLTKETPSADGSTSLEEAYVVLRGPKTMTVATAEALVVDVKAWLTSDTVRRLFGWQS
jgi:hypothetical protein